MLSNLFFKKRWIINDCMCSLPYRIASINLLSHPLIMPLFSQNFCVGPEHSFHCILGISKVVGNFIFFDQMLWGMHPNELYFTKKVIQWLLTTNSRLLNNSCLSPLEQSILVYPFFYCLSSHLIVCFLWFFCFLFPLNA